MAVNTKDEQTLRKYLLGDMSPEEQEELELWLMSSEEAYDLVAAAEDDLIDDSLSGELKGRKRERFENRFLAAPERQRKLQFARSFRRFIDTKGPSASVDKTPSLWEGILDSLRYRPQVAYVLSVLIIAFTVAALWSAFKVAALQRQLRSATEQLAAAERERDDFKRQVAEGQASAQKPPTTPTLLALNLLPGISRSSGDIPKITITPNSPSLELSLVLLDDTYDSYRVTLLDSGGKEQWTKDRLTAMASGNGKIVVVTVPTELISTGDYTVSLAGTSDSHPAENISSFYFRAVRQ